MTVTVPIICQTSFFSIHVSKIWNKFWSWTTWGLNKACIQTSLFPHPLSCFLCPRCCIFHAFWTLLYQNSSSLKLAAMWPCPSNRDCWHMHSLTGWWCWELSFLPCTLLSPSEICYKVMAKGWTPEKTVYSLLWLRFGVSSPSGEGEPVVGRGEWGSASLARMSCPLCLGMLCFLPCRCRGTRSTAAPSSGTCTAKLPARISATTVCPSPATCTTTTSVLWTPASSPWSPSARAVVPSLSSPSSRWDPQRELPSERASRGWRRDRFSRELDCREYSVNFVAWIAKWWRRPQLP